MGSGDGFHWGSTGQVRSRGRLSQKGQAGGASGLRTGSGQAPLSPASPGLWADALSLGVW